MDGMSNRVPVCLFKDAGYTPFIQEEVIPKLIKVIEESGLSYHDAKRVPKELEMAIEGGIYSVLTNTCFKVLPSRVKTD